MSSNVEATQNANPETVVTTTPESIPISQIEVSPLNPADNTKTRDLKRPIYKETARFGHFGRSGEAYTWERTDRVEALRRVAGL